MFISELLALTISHSSEALLRYTWHPSVLLMEMVGTFPSTCETKRSNNYFTTRVFYLVPIHIPKITLKCILGAKKEIAYKSLLKLQLLLSLHPCRCRNFRSHFSCNVTYRHIYICSDLKSNVFGVDDFNNPHHIIKHKSKLLTIICERRDRR